VLRAPERPVRRHGTPLLQGGSPGGQRRLLEWPLTTPIGGWPAREPMVRRLIRWRRQSAANSSRKWSSESQVFGVPTGKWAFSPGDRPIYAIVITLIFRMQVLPRRLIFPSIKERGGSTRSKFVQNVRLFSQLRFKTHNIGSFGHDYQSGILWSRYPIKSWGRSVPCRHRMREKPRRNTSTRDTSPPGASDPRHEKRGPSCFVVRIAIKYLTIRHDMLK
jgi:hypothetical protein